MEKYLIEIIKSKINKKQMLSLFENLDVEDKHCLIDIVILSYNFNYNCLLSYTFNYNCLNVKENEVSIDDKDNIQSQKLVDILSKNNYYKQRIMKLMKESARISGEDFSLVRKMKVDTKAEFFNVLKIFCCETFFLLNYKKFDFDIEEKIIIQNYFKDRKFFKNIPINDKKDFFEKTGLLYPIFHNLDIYDNFNQEEYDLFKSAFNKKELGKVEHIGRLLVIVFLSKIDFDIDKINKKIYLDLFKEHRYLIKELEDYLLKFLDRLKNKEKYKNKNLEKIIGFAEKLIIEDELKYF